MSKKQVYYHGTSADNLKDILKNGLRPDTPKIWESCSRQEVYLWGVEELAKVDGNEYDKQEWKESAARSRATESGQIACSIAKDCRIVIVKCLLDPKQVWEDTSSNNMDGAMCIEIVKPSQIVEIEVSNDLSLIRGFLLASIVDMDMWTRRLSKEEEVVVKALKKVEWYPDNTDEITTWTTIKSKQKVVCCN